MNPDDHAEILRLRKRVHDLQTVVAENSLRIRGVEDWQKRWEPVVAELRESDRIAAAVAARLGADRVQAWRRWDVRLAAVGLAVTAGGVLADIALRLTA